MDSEEDNMERTHTFDLKDMDEAFWKKIIFAQKVKPSGLGGPVDSSDLNA